jgi:hypothetical protein
VVGSSEDEVDSASKKVDSARDATNPASDAADSAGEAVDSAREASPPKQDRNSLVLMTLNASRLLSSGRELALSNLLVSSSVDIATVTDCEMPEMANDFAVAGYKTFLPLVPKGKSKTRVIILVKNGLVTSANVHICPDLMDNQIQSVWLRFGPVSSMGGFTLCGVYRTWSDHDGRVFNTPEAAERLDALNGQITRAAERYARVVVHGDPNLDLDPCSDPLYAQRNLLATLLESTEAASLEPHNTPPTWHSSGLHRVRLGNGGSLPGNGGDRLGEGGSQPGNGGDRLGEGGDQPSNVGDQPGKGGGQPGSGGEQPGEGGNRTNARRAHTARLDHVYTRVFPHASSRVLADSTTDHRPVVTTIASGGSHKLLTKLIRRPFKAIRREALESALEYARDWSGIYAIKDVEEVHKFITGDIIAALDAVAPVKEIVVKTGSNLYLTRETLEMMKRRDSARAGTPRYRALRNAANRLVKRDKVASNMGDSLQGQQQSKGAVATGKRRAR